MPTKVDSRTQADKCIMSQVHVHGLLDRKQVGPQLCGQRLGEFSRIPVVNGCIHNRDGVLRRHKHVLSMRKPVLDPREGEVPAEPCATVAAQQEFRRPDTVCGETLHFPFRLAQEMMNGLRL
jgi:hypothetical protein